MFDFKISQADWKNAVDSGMQYASTFTEQSNTVLMGAVALFWRNSKNTSYINDAYNYAKAYRGLRTNAARSFLTHYTGAKFDEKADKYIGGGKKKACPADFFKMSSWLEYADKKAAEPDYDSGKVEKQFLKTLERKLEGAKAAHEKAKQSGDSLDIMMTERHVNKMQAAYDAVHGIFDHKVEAESVEQVQDVTEPEQVQDDSNDSIPTTDTDEALQINA